MVRFSVVGWILVLASCCSAFAQSSAHQREKNVIHDRYQVVAWGKTHTLTGGLNTTYEVWTGQYKGYEKIAKAILNDVNSYQEEFRRHSVGKDEVVYVGIIRWTSSEPKWQLYIGARKKRELHRIKNAWHADGIYINVEKGSPAATRILDGWKSAGWQLENVDGAVRIRNEWTGKYLNIERGFLECSEVDARWQSAMWRLERVKDTRYYRIQNVWKPNVYLHVQGGGLSAGPILHGWQSAWWDFSSFKR